MLAVGLIVPLLQSVFLEFLSWGGVGFCSRPFLIIISLDKEIIMWFLMLSLYVVGYMYWFMYVELSCIFELKPTWSWWIIFLFALKFTLQIFYWEFCVCIFQEVCTIFLLFCWVFIWSWYQVSAGLVKKNMEILLHFLFYGIIWGNVGVRYFLKIW